jgi:O-antigen ligase
MGVEKLLIVLLLGFGFLIFVLLNFRKALYLWILLAGAIGIPIIIVRESQLMFSELCLAPLLFLWFINKKLGIRFFKLSELSKIKLNIERAIWALALVFTISTMLNLSRDSPAFRNFFEHIISFRSTSAYTFIIGRLVAWFIYVASVLVALLVADTIRSFDDIRRISLLLIALGLFTFFTSFQKQSSFLANFQKGIGWLPLNILNLFSFSLAYLVFHPKIIKKIQSLLICLIFVGQIFVAFILGFARWKTIIIGTLTSILVVFYYRSRALAFLLIYIGLIISILAFALYNFYIMQERQEGALSEYGRFFIWKHSLFVLLENPIFGVGPYNYWDAAITLATRPDSPSKIPLGWVASTPHGQYMQILAETGIVGMVVFLWFIIELFKLLKYFLKKDPDYRINIVAAAVISIIVSRLMIGLIGDYILPQYHNGGLQNFCSTVYFWVCVGILIGLKKLKHSNNGMGTPK